MNLDSISVEIAETLKLTKLAKKVYEIFFKKLFCFKCTP